MVIKSNAVVDEGAVMVHSQSTCKGRVMPAGDDGDGDGEGEGDDDSDGDDDGDGGSESDGDGGGDGDGGSGGGIHVKNATI